MNRVIKIVNGENGGGYDNLWYGSVEKYNLLNRFNYYL